MKQLTKLAAAILAAFALSSATFADAATDASITREVQSKITADSSLKGTAITVTTQDGVVNLKGKVNSETQASAATQIASSAANAKDVDDSKLTVKGSAHPIMDAMLTAKIKGKFIQQKLFGDGDVAAMSINVETNNGVVSLSGTADNQEQIDTAVAIAKGVNGVKEVKSTITLATTSNE